MSPLNYFHFFIFFFFSFFYLHTPAAFAQNQCVQDTADNAGTPGHCPRWWLDPANNAIPGTPDCIFACITTNTDTPFDNSCKRIPDCQVWCGLDLSPCEEPEDDGPTEEERNQGGGGPSGDPLGPDPDTDHGPGPGCDSGFDGNPINTLIGNKFQKEKLVDINRLNLSIHYNSLSGQWYSNLSQKLRINTENTVATFFSADGKAYRFDNISNSWTHDDGVYQLTFSNGIWLLVMHHQRFTFDTNGRLISMINERQATTTTYTYNTAAEVTVSNNEGESYTAILNNHQQPTQITTSAGIINLTWDTVTNNLTLLDIYGSTRIFHYEDTNHPNALTGITDSNNNRYVEWLYDNQGRATTSRKYTSNQRIVEQVTVDYTYINDTNDPRVSVTNSLGKQKTYHIIILNGVRKIRQIEGHSSTNCPASSKGYTYFTNGFIQTKTDWKGNITRYERDAQGRETRRIEAENTPDQREVRTCWHPSHSLLERVITAERVTLYNYFTDGRLESITVEPPTASNSDCPQ